MPLQNTPKPGKTPLISTKLKWNSEPAALRTTSLTVKTGTTSRVIYRWQALGFLSLCESLCFVFPGHIWLLIITLHCNTSHRKNVLVYLSGAQLPGLSLSHGTHHFSVCRLLPNKATCCTSGFTMYLSWLVWYFDISNIVPSDNWQPFHFSIF